MSYKRRSNVRWLLTCVPGLTLCLPSVGCLLPFSQSHEKFERSQTLVSSSRYRIVGNSKPRARVMAKWLDEEVNKFQAEYGVKVNPGGLIYLIEPGEGLPPKIRQWKKHNIVQKRKVAFKPGKDWFSTKYTRRPYCISRVEPHFFESFSVPVKDAVLLDLIDDPENPPSWICILTTSAHLSEAYVRRCKESEKDEVNSIGAKLILGWAWHQMRKFNRKVDLGLMRLQRREAVWSTWIRSSDLSDDSEQLIEALQKRIDHAYAKLFNTRQYD